MKAYNIRKQDIALYLKIRYTIHERGDYVPNFESLYLYLFNRITDAVEEIKEQNYGKAREILMKAQEEAEERYMKEE